VRGLGVAGVPGLKYEGATGLGGGSSWGVEQRGKATFLSGGAEFYFKVEIQERTGKERSRETASKRAGLLPNTGRCPEPENERAASG